MLWKSVHNYETVEMIPRSRRRGFSLYFDYAAWSPWTAATKTNTDKDVTAQNIPPSMHHLLSSGPFQNRIPFLQQFMWSNAYICTYM